MQGNSAAHRNIAIVGSGISGISAAWLLSARHAVTVYESDRRIGGHSHTVTIKGTKGEVAVDTGFIVYNDRTYPNLAALFAHLDVATQPSEMTFAVSLSDGGLEYSGGNLVGLFAEKRNLVRPRFWSMLRDIHRFYREAPRDLAALEKIHTTLGHYLDTRAYGTAFRDDHLLPLASAIWSAPTGQILEYPAASFIRFQNSHGLLSLRNRPPWRSVCGGSRSYVERLTKAYRNRIRLGSAVATVQRRGGMVTVRDRNGQAETFDAIIIATHADQALAMLAEPSPEERRLLGAFRYSSNVAVLHSDPALMPRRRAVWSSWNHIGRRDSGDARDCPTVTYWMNSLQHIRDDTPLFVTLNPDRSPRDEHHREIYEHPLFDSRAILAQQELWSLQGRRNTWFAGAYFGSGFHEDGLQAGLAAAEAAGGVRRPWNVADESGRIVLPPPQPSAPIAEPELAA
jgi:predicted NAD/FAD-binding protein